MEDFCYDLLKYFVPRFFRAKVWDDASEIYILKITNHSSLRLFAAMPGSDKMILVLMALFLMIGFNKAAIRKCPEVSSQMVSSMKSNLTGSILSEQDWPWVLRYAVIGDRDGQLLQHNCVGTVLPRRWIMLPEWCFKDIKTKDSQSFSLSGTEPMSNLSYYRDHSPPEKDENPLNNILLFETSQQMNFTSSFSPGCLKKNYVLADDEIFAVAGWMHFMANSTIEDVGILETKKHYRFFRQKNDDACRALKPAGMSDEYYNKNIICVGGDFEEGAYRFGSPLMIVRNNQWFVIGYSTYYKPDSSDRMLFTRIDRFCDWLSTAFFGEIACID
uniref:Peptidase S1 domain-containing protein n=1 Tax=Panagrolaimus sp. JU765 TaxID=591449 RepID=A0AC34QX19_9BILA